MKNLSSFEDAAKFIGVDPKLLPEVSHLPERFQKSQIALYKISVISEAAWKKEKQTIDWYNWDQRKYYVWWDMSPGEKPVGSASGFSVSVIGYDSAYSCVGSRLVFPTREITEYVSKKYMDLFRDLMIIE